MAPRGHRRRRKPSADDSDEDDADDTGKTLAALSELPVILEKRARVGGVQADALAEGASERASDRPLQDGMWGVVAGAAKPDPATDLIERRMEEYVDAGVKRAFKHANEEDGQPARGSAELPTMADVPSHLQGTQIREVSVPGFNLAITEFKDSGGVNINDLGEVGKPASRRQPVKQHVPDLLRSKNAPYVPRDLFPTTFGKHRKRDRDETSQPHKKRRD